MKKFAVGLIVILAVTQIVQVAFAVPCPEKHYLLYAG